MKKATLVIALCLLGCVSSYAQDSSPNPVVVNTQVSVAITKEYAAKLREVGADIGGGQIFEAVYNSENANFVTLSIGNFVFKVPVSGILYIRGTKH